MNEKQETVINWAVRSGADFAVRGSRIMEGRLQQFQAHSVWQTNGGWNNVPQSKHNLWSAPNSVAVVLNPIAEQYWMNSKPSETVSVETELKNDKGQTQQIVMQMPGNSAWVQVQHNKQGPGQFIYFFKRPASVDTAYKFTKIISFTVDGTN